MVVGSTGTLYITDTGNQRLRRVPWVAVPATGTVGTFVNVRSALLLEIYGESLDEGAEIHQYTDNGGDHQRWQLTVVDQDSGHDVYTITDVGSGKVIEVVEAQTQAGAIAVQRTYGGEDAHHQQWPLIPIGPDTGGANVYKIMNRNSGLVLDAETDTATVIKQYGSWDDDGRQRWRWIHR